MIYTFADCELDDERFQLRREGQVVAIEPKVFDVLLHLVRAGDRVVPKTELLDELWAGETVTEAVLPRAIAGARRAIGDDRGTRRLIQTVHRRGYRLAVPVAYSNAAAPASAGRPGPFVGREEAMDRLRSALDDARAARGRVALLVGEPGIGKTRTLEELVGEASRQGAGVLTGRSYEGEGAPAYWPWVQVLRGACAGLPPDSLDAELGPAVADLAELVPELRRHSPESPRDVAAEIGQERFRVFDTVTRFLRWLSRDRPQVVAIDDLHSADPDSLVLFEFLAASLRDVPLLLIGTYRDMAVRRGHPLGSMLGALARERHCERITLRGLPREAVGQLISELAGSAPPEEIGASIYETTEGNPFFVQEIVRVLLERGQLDASDPREAGLTLPQSVRDAIGRRLDLLSPACNELLRAAAVIGREFHAGPLESATGISAPTLLELLGEAVGAGVVLESRDSVGRYAFSHALVHQTLYEELSMPQRTALHRRIGEALEEGGSGALEGRLPELAHHFFEAAPGGDVERAVDWCVRAARHAYGRFAYDEAARHYERALEAQQLSIPVDGARRGEILLALGEAWWAAGGRQRCRGCFAEAAEIGRRLGRADVLARAAVGLRAHGELGIAPDLQTVDVLEEAREATREGYPALHARVLARMATSRFFAESMANRESFAREAYEIAMASGDRTAVSDALTARHWATLGPDRVDERLEVGREACDLGERWGDPRLRMLGLEAQIGAYLIAGNVEAARTEIDAYEALAKEVRQPLFLFLASLLRGSEAMSSGRFEESERHFREALERGVGPVHYAELLHNGARHWLDLLRGDFAGFAEVESFMRERGMQQVEGTGALLETSLAQWQLASGDLESARRQLAVVARSGFSKISRDEHWFFTMHSLVVLVVQLGDEEHANELYGLLLPYRQRFVSHDLLRAVSGSVEGRLGDLSVTLGRYEEGIRHFSRALELERAQELAPAVCDSLAGLARLYHLRAGAKDRRRAEALLAEAEAGARAIGSRREFRSWVEAARGSKPRES